MSWIKIKIFHISISTRETAATSVFILFLNHHMKCYRNENEREDESLRIKIKMKKFHLVNFNEMQQQHPRKGVLGFCLVENLIEIHTTCCCCCWLLLSCLKILTISKENKQTFCTTPAVEICACTKWSDPNESYVMMSAWNFAHFTCACENECK